MKKSVINYLSANLSKRVNQPRAIISFFPKEKQRRPLVKTYYEDFCEKKTQNSEYINIFHTDMGIWEKYGIQLSLRQLRYGLRTFVPIFKEKHFQRFNIVN